MFFFKLELVYSHRLFKKFAAVTGALSRCRSILQLQAKLQIYYALFFIPTQITAISFGLQQLNLTLIVLSPQRKELPDNYQIQTALYYKRSISRAQFTLLRADKMYELRLLIAKV